MTGLGDRVQAEEAALWRRFRAEAGQSPMQGKDLPGGDLILAAYAEGRLGTAAAERVETWLVANPEACADLAAVHDLTPAEAPQAMLDRAMALVAADDGRVVQFRRPVAVRSNWRLGVARIAVAASLLITGLAGFAMGSNVYGSFLSGADAASEFFDQPIGLFSGGEDTSI